MSKPQHPKPPYLEVSKHSAAYKYYALGYVTPRVNFVLNHGDLSCPKAVMVLQPEQLEEQLNAASSQHIKKNVKVDREKRVILVPKVCDVFRSDFAIEGPGGAAACLQYCLGFMEEDQVNQIQDILRDNPNIAIKFQPITEFYHTYLRLDSFAGAHVGEATAP